MKHSVKLLSLLLSLALLLSCLPGAAAEPDAQTRGGVAEPDFSALVETGGAESVPGVILRTEPLYYADYIGFFTGNYALYRDASTGCLGIIDCNGRILWQPNDPELEDVMTFACGLCAVLTMGKGWQIYTVYGKCISPASVYCGEVNGQWDWATGQELYAVGQTWDAEHPGKYGGILADAAGHVIYEEDIGSAYNGKLPFRRDGKWGLRAVAGEVLLSPQYDELRFLSKDTLLARRDGVYTLIGTDGAVKATLNGCTAAESLAPNVPLLLVQENGLWGVRDETGALRLDARWESLYAQYYGQGRPYELWLRGTDAGIEHFLSLDGVDLPLPETAHECIVQPLFNNCFLIGSHDAGYWVTDEKGTDLLGERFEGYGFNTGASVVHFWNSRGSGDGRTYDCTVFDSAMQPLLHVDGARCFATTADTAVYEKNGDMHFVSLADGTELSRLENTKYSSVMQRFVLVTRDGMFAMTDLTGSLLTEFEYSQSRYVAGEIACLSREGSYYLLDCRGRELTPPLDEPVGLNEELSPCAAYKSGGKYGFLQYRGADDPLFADVAAGSWYAEGADFCAKTGLMNGVGGGKFAPQTVMTRAMLVRVLYNLSGSPCASYGFEDVPAGTWYTDAVNWAAANGIVNGKSATRFAPNDPVTREQIATILLRYAAKFAEFEVSDDALASFADEGQVSAFAREAMQWAVTQGLIQGVTATELRPNGQATRAQVATILTRLVKLMATPSP